MRIEITDLVVKRSQRTLVDKLSFEIRANEVLGIIGPNGAGKSTVLATLAGIDSVSAGVVKLDGRDITQYSAAERARELGWVEQAGSVSWPLSVERLVMLGRIPRLPRWGNATEADHRAVEDALENADCMELRHRRMDTLSGGERARVLLARALSGKPTVLFADEPVSALDLGHQLQTMQLLADYAVDERAVVVVMHDLSLAVRYCNRLALMHKGKLIAIGEPAAVLSHENIADVYGVSVVTGCESVPWVVPEHLLHT